jgi:hypothetical protein
VFNVDEDISEIKKQRAETELRELAVQLFVAEVEPYDILLDVARRNVLLGCPFQSVLPFIRALPGLSKWHAGRAWQERVNAHDQDELVAGLESPEIDEYEQHRRAWVLAEWLVENSRKAIVEDAIAAAVEVAVDHLSEGVDDGQS